MKTGIVGLGSWIPETVRTNDAWPQKFVETHGARLQSEFTTTRTKADGDETDRIVVKHFSPEALDPFLGARKRRVADSKMTAHEAETLAARAAIEDAGIDPRDVGAVLSATAVPDRITPPTAAYVAHHIGASKAFGAALDAVCASSILGLDLACALVESGRAKYVVLTQSHLMTRAFPTMHPVSPSVGDAATAMIVGKVERGGLLACRSLSNGEFFDAVVWKRPKEEDTPWWLPGGAMAMGSCDSERARILVQDTVRVGADALREVSDAAHVRLSDIDVVASVQPRRWIPRAIAEAAGVRDESVVVTFDEYAHLGACGVVVNLLEARKLGRLVPGARAALYGQGAGFTRSAAIVEW